MVGELCLVLRPVELGERAPSFLFFYSGWGDEFLQQLLFKHLNTTRVCERKRASGRCFAAYVTRPRTSQSTVSPSGAMRTPSPYQLFGEKEEARERAKERNPDILAPLLSMTNWHNLKKSPFTPPENSITIKFWQTIHSCCCWHLATKAVVTTKSKIHQKGLFMTPILSSINTYSTFRLTLCTPSCLFRRFSCAAQHLLCWAMLLPSVLFFFIQPPHHWTTETWSNAY